MWLREHIFNDCAAVEIQRHEGMVGKHGNEAVCSTSPMEDSMMMRHAFDLSGYRLYRLTAIAFSLATGLAMAPAFAQTTPTTPTTPSTSPPNAPMNEVPPASDTVGSPAPNTDTAPTTTAATNTKPATFQELDANHDGKLSRDDVAADPLWSKDFDIADTNHDGFISKSEFKKHEAELKRTAQTESNHNAQPGSDHN
jgi:EF hand